MNPDMIRPKNATEDFLRSTSKNCETPMKQTHTKPQETLEFKFIQPKKNFSLKPSINLDVDFRWMIGLTS